MNFSLEQVTPVQEWARGRHGSPDQSTGGSLILSNKSSNAVTAEQCVGSNGLIHHRTQRKERKKHEAEGNMVTLYHR